MPRPAKKTRPKPSGPPPSAPVPARTASLCAIGVFLASFVVYLLTVIPTVVDQDSGELVAAAHVLGIPHPTGYPLWTMLGRVFDLLPIGHTSAYRVALLSAVSAAGAAAVISWLTISLASTLLPGVFAGISFALWFPTWSQAVRAEVYALAGLLFALFLLLLWRWDRERSPRQLYWLALAAGFVSMHHRTGFLAAAPALLAAFWLTRPRRAKIWLFAAALFLAPFLCYLYLPIRAASRPPMNWGNPDTLDRFLPHVLGRQYSRWAFMNPLDVAVEQAGKLLGEALAGDGWPSVLLALVGAPIMILGFVSWCRRRPVPVISLGTGAVLLTMWVLGWGEISDLKVFLSPLGAVLALLGGLGLARVTTHLPMRAVGPYLAASAGLSVCLILLLHNWPRSDQSNVWLHRDRCAAALAQMDQNAIFVAEWDNPMFATYYLQHVEGMRRDITLLRPQGLWSSWYVDLIPDQELARTSQELWRQIDAQSDIRRPGSPQFWQAAARLAYLLAQHYHGRRPVYALHGPVMTLFPGPPHFVCLNESLVKLEFERPDPLRLSRIADPIAEFPGGVKLVHFDIAAAEARTGELVEFRASWRLDSPLSGALFGLKFLPARLRGSTVGGVPGDTSDWLSEKGLFVQGFHLLYALYGLPPSPPGTVYEQIGKLIIPSNAPPGRYNFEIAFAQSYPPKFDHWVELGEAPTLLVHPRPLPTNPP